MQPVISRRLDSPIQACMILPLLSYHHYAIARVYAIKPTTDE
jgi:hypothetical protein